MVCRFCAVGFACAKRIWNTNRIYNTNLILNTNRVSNPNPVMNSNRVSANRSLVDKPLSASTGARSVYNF